MSFGIRLGFSCGNDAAAVARARVVCHISKMQSFSAPAAPGAPAQKADLASLKRFMPYLWPVGETALRARVVIAMVLVILAKSTSLVMPFAFKGAIDRMAAGVPDGIQIAVALVCAYALARFGGVLFDNLRNAIFEKVGQTAARRLSDLIRISRASCSSAFRPLIFATRVSR